MELRMPEMTQVLDRFLDPKVRYRAVLFQVADDSLKQFDLLGACVTEILSDVVVLTNDDFLMEDQTVKSVTAVLSQIKESAARGALLINGPLRILNIWTEHQQRTFWQEMATYSGGDGIVILDRVREQVVRPLFHVEERMNSADVLVLRSRLVQAEE